MKDFKNIKNIEDVRLFLEDEYGFSGDKFNVEKDYSVEEILSFLKKLDVLFDDLNFSYRRGASVDYINDEFVEVLLEVSEGSFSINDFLKINFKSFEGLRKHDKVYRELLEFVKDVLISKNVAGSVFEKSLEFDLDQKNRRVCKEFSLEILKSFEKRVKDIGVNDFLINFNKRYDYYRELISSKINIDDVLSIDLVAELSDEVVDVVGLVYEIRKTRKGYVLEIEDKSAQIRVFFNSSQVLEVEKIKSLVLDEGVYVRGVKGKDNIIWGEKIVDSSLLSFSDEESGEEVKSLNELNKLDEDVFAIFLGGLKVGSSAFLYDEFDKLVAFLSSKTKSKRLNRIAKRIKYIFLSGDLICELEDENSLFYSFDFKYFELTRLLMKLPEDKCIVLIPGENDFVRRALPQSFFDYSDLFSVYNLKNTLVLSNPSRVCFCDELKDFRFSVSLFAGNNFSYYENEVESLRKSDELSSVGVGKFLIEKNHFSPTFQACPFFPNLRDDDLKLESSNLFVFGNSLRTAVDSFNQSLVFACSDWILSKQDYNVEKRAQSILLNLKDKKVSLLKF